MPMAACGDTCVTDETVIRSGALHRIFAICSCHSWLSACLTQSGCSCP